MEQVVGAGLVPIYCRGESERCGAAAAARACRKELDDALTTAQAVSPDPEVVVAYEPLWAIGATEPAPAGHVSAVCTALQDVVRRRHALPTSGCYCVGPAEPGASSAPGYLRRRVVEARSDLGEVERLALLGLEPKRDVILARLDRHRF